MKKLLKMLFTITAMITMFHVTQVCADAAYYRQAPSSKQKIGDNYIWVTQNDDSKHIIHIIKKNGSARTITEYGYSISVLTDGNTIYYSSLPNKYDPNATFYKYDISTGKQTKIGTLKYAIHMHAYYNGNLYFISKREYRGPVQIEQYNLKTKKRTILNPGGKYGYIEDFYGQYMYCSVYTSSYESQKFIAYNMKTGKTTVLSSKYSYYKKIGNYLYFVKQGSKISTTTSGKAVYRYQVYRCARGSNVTKAVSKVFYATAYYTYDSKRVYYYNTSGKLVSLAY